MLTLAVESSASAASAALLKDNFLIAEVFQNTSLTHSQTLVPMIHDMLKNTSVSLDEVDLLAVAHGPGSFTGLRIGVSAVKGLAFTSNKPCAGVSTLEAMAYNLLFFEGIVCCVMDARCHQVYNGLFEVKNSTITRLCDDRPIAIDDLASELTNYQSIPIALVGDGAILCASSPSFEAQKNIQLVPGHLRYQRAFGVAMAAQTAEKTTCDQLRPVYLRLPQATRELKGRMNK